DIAFVGGGGAVVAGGGGAVVAGGGAVVAGCVTVTVTGGWVTVTVTVVGGACFPPPQPASARSATARRSPLRLLRQVALARRNADGLLLDEVTDLENALPDLDERAVTAVARNPRGAADRRRAVVPARPEAPL